MIPLQFALRRRMMMAGGLLPSGYTRVDYIQGTGSQYIDTGFVVNKSDNYALEIDGLFPSQAQTYQGCNGYMQFFVSSKYGISNESSISVGNRDTVRIAYANQTATLTVNGSQAESKSWASYSGANVKLGVLRMGDINNGWFSGSAASGTIYGYKVWKDGILVSECIPCRRKSDGVLGVYDAIQKIFITNSGTGTFVAPGEEVTTWTVTLTGSHTKSSMVNNYIVYGDIEYTSGSFTVADGEIIRVYWSNRDETTNGIVKLNGTIVAGGVSFKTGYYSYTVSSNCTINGIYRLQWDPKDYGSNYITTT